MEGGQHQEDLKKMEMRKRPKLLEPEHTPSQDSDLSSKEDKQDSDYIQPSQDSNETNESGCEKSKKQAKAKKETNSKGFSFPKWVNEGK